ncbi:toprim domain-containing protein [Furfurilactobacillus sp. WILCCON 0119]
MQTQDNEIVDYLDYAGIPYERQGNYVTPTAHDSMKIDLRKGYFTQYSTGAWGDLVAFVKTYEDGVYEPAKSTKEAFQRVNEFRAAVGRGDVVPHQFAVEPARPFNLADYQYQQDPEAVYTYLCGERQLARPLVEQLVAADLVREIKAPIMTPAAKKRWENEHPGEHVNGRIVRQLLAEHKLAEHDYFYGHEVMFAWKDQTGKIVGADRQGTYQNKAKFGKRGTSKLIVPGSATNFGWHFRNSNQQPDTMVITEAPIDTMSYFQLHHRDFTGKSVEFCSLSGSESKAKSVSNLMKQLFIDPGYGRPKEVHFAVDNDRAGHGLVQKFIDVGWDQLKPETMKVMVDVPKVGKDWNDQVKAGVAGKEVLTLKQFEQRFKPEKQPKLSRTQQLSKTQER